MREICSPQKWIHGLSSRSIPFLLKRRKFDLFSVRVFFIMNSVIKPFSSFKFVKISLNQFTIPARQQPWVHHKRWKRDSRVSHEFKYHHKRSTVSRRFFRIVNCRDISLCIALGEAPLRSQRDFPQICILTQPTNHVHIPMAACIPGRRSRHEVPSHCRGDTGRTWATR